MSTPIVSVITPNYNYGRFIAQTIESVLNQKFDDFEMIIVDNGSTDESVSVIESFARRYPGRIRLFREGRIGLPESRNMALAHCRGSFITFLDSDDLWMPDFLNTMMHYYHVNPEAKAVYSNAELFESSTGRSLGRWFQPGAAREPFWGHCEKMLFLHGNFIPILTAMLRREVFDLVEGFDAQYRVGEDWDFWIRLTERFEIGYLDTVLARVRRHSANQSFIPLNDYNRMRIYRKTLRRNHALEKQIGAAPLRDCWHRAYYEAGRTLALQGKPHRARHCFRAALSFHRDFFATRLWLYYPLTYVIKLRFIRVWLANLRRFMKTRVFMGKDE